MPANFEHFLRLIKPYMYISKKGTRMRKAVDLWLKLAITLHHLAEGVSHTSIAAHYRLGKATTSIAIDDTVAALWRVLMPIYMKAPNGPFEWKKTAQGLVGVDYKSILILLKNDCFYCAPNNTNNNLYNNNNNNKQLYFVQLHCAVYHHFVPMAQHSI